jgi:hypothetical protein
MWDVMAEPGTLAVEEIDAILEGIEYRGGIGIVVRQPDGTFKRSSTIWALGMHSNACRSWYQTRFGQPLPWWTEKLHPRHIVDLVKRCLAINQRLPQMYAGK